MKSELIPEKSSSAEPREKMVRRKSAKVSEVESTSAGDKAEQILQGAMKVFLVQGYAATSMDRVAEEAGVSKATVYSHFHDKEGLFKAIVEHMARRKFKQIYGDEPLQGDPEVVLRRLGSAALDQCTQDQEYFAFIRLIIGESGRFPELAKTFVECLTKPSLDHLTKYLANCPELDLPDPEATARILTGSCIQFVMTQEMLHGRDIMPMERDRLLDALAHLILKSSRVAPSSVTNQ